MILKLLLQLLSYLQRHDGPSGSQLCPHVVKYIAERKEDFRIKNNIDPDKHMARLNYLGQIAEENKMVGVALRAEELRGKVAGYYIDRQIIKSKDSLDNLSAEQLEDQMKKILEDNKHFINNVEVKDD